MQFFQKILHNFLNFLWFVFSNKTEALVAAACSLWFFMENTANLLDVHLWDTDDVIPSEDDCSDADLAEKSAGKDTAPENECPWTVHCPLCPYLVNSHW